MRQFGTISSVQTLMTVMAMQMMVQMNGYNQSQNVFESEMQLLQLTKKHSLKVIPTKKIFTVFISRKRMYLLFFRVMLTINGVGLQKMI